MLKINYMSTLFVGIDVSSKSNVVCAIDFYKKYFIKTSVTNNQPGAYDLVCQIVSVMQKHTDLNTVVVALESTSIYSIHIANFLSSCEELMPYRLYVFYLNPKMTANYRKSFIGMNKTDLLDAFIIADFARVGRIENLSKTADLLKKAANSMKNHTVEYHDYYYKKYNEVPKHKHKRALALTSRKLVHLIFGLLYKEKLYSTDKVNTLS